MSDWITEFLSATSTVRSPEIFRLWTGIATVAACLERRVYTVTDVDKLYPNLYIVLVGAPASGKSLAVNEARKCIGQLNQISLGPDDPTRASFFDALYASGKGTRNGAEIYYSSLVILCREFGVLFKPNDDIYPYLTDLYDNLPNFTSPRRTSVSVNITKPSLNILAAATPAAIGKLPEAAWGEGFTSRVIFLYGSVPQVPRDMFKPRTDSELEHLRPVLSEIAELSGRFTWSDDAVEAMNYWFNVEKLKPVPTYGRLVNYIGRRDTQATKLAMISAVSNGRGLHVTIDDFNRGRQWLLDAEKTMPDVFRAMVLKSDSQVLQDMHYHFYILYNRTAVDKRRPIKESEIWRWFEERTTSDKIPYLIKAMESTARMRRALAPNEWVPNNLDFDKPEV